jgi:quercetin dioxygenase-like cupin family protein
VTKTFNVGFAEHGIGIEHHFSSGVYAKRVDIPAGRVLQQHAHPFDHLSILARGTVLLKSAGHMERVKGPAVLTIPANTLHEVESLTDAVWLCIHATDETDPDKIDGALTSEH